MTFAKSFIIGTVRAVRQIGTVGLFVVGLLIGSALVAQSPETFSFKSESAHLTASAAEIIEVSQRELPTQPWSRAMGKPGFEKVTDVTLDSERMLVFAGISLGAGGADASHAMLVRTGPHGFVHSHTYIRDDRLGNVTRAVLGNTGGARLVHWVGNRPAFASVTPDGAVVWSRAFDTQSDSVWAEVEVAGRGETLVALTEGDAIQTTRILRLDDNGRVLWRHKLEGRGPLQHISLSDSGDGGALLATEYVSGAERHVIAMARIDRRGREVWSRTLISDYGASLAHTDLSNRGGVVLVGGEPSALFRFDATGQLNWIREVPALDPAGRHLVSEAPDGGWHVLAEPQSATQTRRHWLARFDAEGRMVWSQTRANRSGTSFEAAMIVETGAMLAGGSMVAGATGDTDMLFMAIGEGGQFPMGIDGPEQPELDTAPRSDMILASNTFDQPLLPASAVVDSTLDIQTETRPVAAMADLPRREPIDTPVRPEPVPEIEETVTLAAAPSLNDALFEPAAASMPVEQPAATAQSTVSVAKVDAAPQAIMPSAPRLKPGRIKLAEPTRLEERELVLQSATLSTTATAVAPVSFACTFTCLADSQDVVPYPVRRIIDDASEVNASLFALDVMAMDHSVCMSTGGRVYDLPRLPPACERLN